MNALRRLAGRSRVARALLFALLFPFFCVYAFVRDGLAWKPFGLTTEHGKIHIGWRDVLPLDEMAAVLDQRRAELRSVST